MPYALITDGYTLKKVNKTQEKAVKDFRRSEYIKELLDNETTLPILLGPVLVPIIGVIVSELLKNGSKVDTTSLQKRIYSLLTTLQFKRQEADAPVGSGIQSGIAGETVRPGEASEDFIWLDLLTKNPFFGYEPPVRRKTPVRRQS